MESTPLPALAAAAGPATTAVDAARITREWIETNLPPAWRAAGDAGGPVEVRRARTPQDYREWYPVFGGSGLAVPTWEVDHGGLGWTRDAARSAETVLAPYHLPRLNPLGLNLAAPALFSFGTDEQRRRFLPPIVRAEEIWCQLFSEPGAGSDLASLSTRAERQGDGWSITGQKIWTTWADRADFAVLLARTDPDLPKHQGITYFVIDIRQEGVTRRPLRHMGGETEFFQVFLDGALVPDSQRIGEIGEGWKVAQATLGGERQMVAGSGSGGVDRVGGASALHLVRLARERSRRGLPGGWDDPMIRDSIVRLWSEERVRQWTNQRVRDQVAQKLAPGPESSIGKVHGSDLNQRIQSKAAALLGMDGIAWAGDPGDDDGYAASMPPEAAGLLRSRANTIEGGTSEVNKNLLAERVLGLPREPDPFKGLPWRDLPRG